MAPPSETPTAITAGPSSQNKPSLKSKASSSTTSLSLQPLSLADSPRLSHPISCDGCPPPKLETLRDLLLILYHDGNVHIITIAISRLDDDGGTVKTVSEFTRGPDLCFACDRGRCNAKYVNAYAFKAHWLGCKGLKLKNNFEDSTVVYSRKQFSSWNDAVLYSQMRVSRHAKTLLPGPLDHLSPSAMVAELSPERQVMISDDDLARVIASVALSPSSSSSLSSLVGSAAITPSTSTSTLASSIDEAPATPLFLHFDAPSTLTLDDACGTFELKSSSHVLPPDALNQPGPWVFQPLLRRSGSLTDLQQEGTSSRNCLRPSASLSDLRATLLREDQAGVSPVISSLASSSASAATTDSVWWKRRELPLEEMFQKGSGLGTQSE